MQERGTNGPQARAGRCCGAPENAEDFVNLRVARPQRLAVDELGEDAANGPHVHGGRVRALAEQDFGRAVPQRDHLVRVGAHGDHKGARQAKVGELEHAALVHEQVLRLEVAVHDAARVAVVHAGQHLVHQALRGGERAERKKESGKRTREKAFALAPPRSRVHNAP
jgi:hypothetical protein